MYVRFLEREDLPVFVRIAANMCGGTFFSEDDVLVSFDVWVEGVGVFSFR